MGFLESQSKAIDVAVPLALKLHELRRKEAKDAQTNALANMKFVEEIGNKRIELDLQKKAAALKEYQQQAEEGSLDPDTVNVKRKQAGLQDLPTRTATATFENVMDPEELRQRLAPGSEMGLPQVPLNADEMSGANVDVSRLAPIMPVPKFLREKQLAMEQAKTIAEMTADRSIDVANINKSGRIEAANINANKERQSKLLTPEEEAQQIRIAGAKSAASGAAGAFKEGTIDYMVQKYETDGVIPPFGMGSVGAKQRAAFFDKAAQRAAERGDTGGAQAIRGAEFKSIQSTLTDLTKREQLINSYNVRINETSDKVLIPLIKKWDLQNPRFLNWPVNKLAEIMGSGDLAALKLALNSVSVEVGKVEFNALGIQQLTDSASKFMNSVHDPNMKVGELLKVIDTSKQLGETGINAISQQRKDLVSRMGKIAPSKVETSPETSASVTPRKAGESIGDYLKRTKK